MLRKKWMAWLGCALLLLFFQGCTPLPPDDLAARPDGGAQRGVDPTLARRQVAETLIETFVRACNELDVEGMLGCLDPSVGMTASFFSAVIGEELGLEEDLLSLAPGIVSFAETFGLIDQNMRPQVQIVPLEFQYQENQIDVYVQYRMDFNGETEEGMDWLSIADKGAKPYIILENTGSE